jgi:nucleoside 2-deoxyribosyltransferase
VSEAAAAPPSHQAACEAYLSACAGELDAGATVDDRLLWRWMADLQALEASPGADPVRTLDTMERMLQLAIQRADGDVRTMLTLQLEGLRSMQRQAEGPPLPVLDADALVGELARLRGDADAQLAAGESPEVVITSMLVSWPGFMLRLGDDPEPRAAATFLTGLVDIFSQLERTVPAEKREAFADTMTVVRRMMDEVSKTLQTPGGMAPDPLLMPAVAHDLAGLAAAMNDPQPADLAPWGLQLLEGLALLQARVMRICEDRGRRRDGQEAERMRHRVDVVLGRMRGAGDNPVRFAAALQRHLRPFLLELRRFERRYQAMLIEAPYPPRASTIDANAVHLVVGDGQRSAVEAAVAAIGMVVAEPFGTGDPMQLRWHQLRRAAVAVLDYSAYDPARADPAATLPADPASRRAQLEAAAPVAATAYEHGWAIALGTPVVPLVRAGSPLPFDVTTSPVALACDGRDLDRLASAIHGALLPDEWLGEAEQAEATCRQLRMAFGGQTGTQELLDAAGDGSDGMALVLAAESLIQRVPGARRTLAFPGFAPSYPDPAAEPLVFHVTAFRGWSRDCERELRAACARAGWRYAIGYERLDPDIMRAIWNDVAQASLVVADVTALNPNAVLELGLAVALGRPVVVLSRQAEVPQWLPALAKVRVHTYAPESEAGRADLAALLDEQLARVWPPAGPP